LRNVFGEEVSVGRKRKGPGGPRKSGKKSVELGCEHCTLNGVPGLNKVINLDRIIGRRAMLWAQSPGRNENAQGKELIGKAGEFLWRELSDFGIPRSIFDIQNCLRCRPLAEDGKEYEPQAKEFKQALRCCSIYNHEAIERNRSKAQVHLILGKVAGVQLLGKAYNKAKPAIWHEPWNAYVVLADHPSALLRRGGRGAGWAYFAFRDRLKGLKAILDHPGRWGYVKSLDSGAVTTPKEAEELKQTLLAEAAAGRRISVDIEDGTVDGKPVILMIGFGWGQWGDTTSGGKGPDESGFNWRRWKNWRGKARSVILHHPEASQDPRRLNPLLKMLKEVLEDPNIRKVLQHGSYDVKRLRNLLNIRIRGYNFDTQYGTYLKYSHLRSYSLDSQAGYFYPEYGDYKLMVEPWKDNFAKAPLEVLVPYNCADCHLTKQIETRTTKISLPLLKVYIDTAFILEDMETRGPLLDREAHAKVTKIVDEHLEALLLRLRQVAGDPEFNPNTPAQVAKLIYDKLKLPMVELKGKKTRSTSKDVMELLTLRTKSPVPQMITDYRGLAKVKGTYLVGYERSANLHEGMLHTHWFLTGAVTGRLRSGGEKKGGAGDGSVNLQNLHGNPILKNMLVSDLRWRLALGGDNA
jgi:uracil-DNA glycosylase family 4